MITEDQITRAEQAAAAAQAWLEKMAPMLADTADGGAVLAAAQGRLEIATGRLARLREQFAAEREAIAARPGVEKAAAKYVEQASADLRKSRALVVGLANTAQDALEALNKAAEDHDALVRQTAGELAAKGLTLVEGADFQTGGSRDGGVRLRGQWWLPLNSVQLVSWVGARVGQALAGGLVRVFGHPMERRGDGLLSDVATPRVVPVAWKWPTRGAVEGAPVGISDYDRERERRNREVKTVTMQPGPGSLRA